MLPFIQSSYLAGLLECFSAGVVIMNVRGDVYAVNEMACHLFGMERGQLLDIHFTGALLDQFDDGPGVERFLAHAREQNSTPASLQTIFKHPTGGLRNYTLSISRLIEYGKIFGIVLQIGDVTHIYELHEREKRMLEERSAMQQERIDSLAQLSMAIAHQIRNPLMTIGGFARLLQKKNSLRESGAGFLQGILDGSKRLEDVVRAVTDYTASRPPNFIETDMNVLVSSAIERISPCPSGVRIDAWPDWPVWKLDPKLTNDALHELLLNALEALETKGGIIQVLWREQADGCELEVRDDGPGIALSIQPFLFDPFFTTKAVGVGMGLAKARKWLREQGGDLTINNAETGGIRAILCLPEACILKTQVK